MATTTQMRCAVQLGIVHQHLGRLDEAMAWYAQSSTWPSPPTIPLGRRSARQHRMVHAAQGRLVEATRCLEASLVLARIRGPAVRRHTLCNLGLLLQQQGSSDQAITRLERRRCAQQDDGVPPPRSGRAVQHRARGGALHRRSRRRSGWRCGSTSHGASAIAGSRGIPRLPGCAPRSAAPGRRGRAQLAEARSFSARSAIRLASPC